MRLFVFEVFIKMSVTFGYHSFYFWSCDLGGTICFNNCVSVFISTVCLPCLFLSSAWDIDSCIFFKFVWLITNVLGCSYWLKVFLFPHLWWLTLFCVISLCWPLWSFMSWNTLPQALILRNQLLLWWVFLYIWPYFFLATFSAYSFFLYI